MADALIVVLLTAMPVYQYCYQYRIDVVMMVFVLPYTRDDIKTFFGAPGGVRTRDLHRERVAS